MTDKPLYTLHRSDDPDTSVEAAEVILPKLSEIQQRVYALIGAAGLHGITQYELSERISGEERDAEQAKKSTWRSRVPELEELGLVRCKGKRRVADRQRRVFAVLTKPYDPQDLLRSLRLAMATARMRNVSSVSSPKVFGKQA